MSGICGIIHPGSTPDIQRLAEVAAAMGLPGDRPSRPFVHRAAAMAVASRWSFQEVSLASNILVAVDADLLNLESLGNDVTEDSDGEPRGGVSDLIRRLYLLHGPDFVNLLEGSFSVAIWDDRNQRLVLAIDAFAAKNLYWTLDHGQLIFASRAGAVREGQAQRAAVSESALAQFLIFSVVPAPLSIYRGIHRLEPGQILIYESEQIKTKRYWDLSYSESEDRTEETWAEQLREQIRSATHRALSGCEPASTGAYLSGGTDSSSVVAFMSEKHASVNTFSIAFSEDKYNEIDYARTTAQQFGARHTEYVVTAQDAIDAIPKITGYFDEPFANSSAIGGYYCARMARAKGMHVLLAGDGGDEIFAGNQRYADDKRFQIYHSIPTALRRGIVEPFSRLLPATGPLSLFPRYIRRANIPNPRRVISYGLFLSETPEDIFEPEFLRLTPPVEWLSEAERHHCAGANRSELNRMLYTDVKITLGDNDLRKVSGTAELAGVGVRYPLLDRKLVSFAGQIPSKLKMKGFAKRYIFKKAMRSILSPKVLHKTKHGFGVPVSVWLLQNPKLGAMTLDLLNDSRTRQRGYFRPGFIDRLLHLHKTGHTAYYGEVVWYLLVLEMWHRQHVEAEREVAFAH